MATNTTARWQSGLFIILTEWTVPRHSTASDDSVNEKKWAADAAHFLDGNRSPDSGMGVVVHDLKVIKDIIKNRSWLPLDL
jgi:hypothetical protein